jgi:hypothetical protein
MSYTEPWVAVLAATSADDVATVRLRFERFDRGPLALGALYREPGSNREMFVLHREVDRSGDEATFETYGSSAFALPRVGDILYHRGWWLGEALEAVLDPDGQWEHRTYPDDGGHHHCLFTWEPIAAYEEHRVGWFSRKYGWITEGAHADFIQGDIYKYRSDRREGV